MEVMYVPHWVDHDALAQGAHIWGCVSDSPAKNDAHGEMSESQDMRISPSTYQTPRPSQFAMHNLSLIPNHLTSVYQDFL